MVVRTTSSCEPERGGLSVSVMNIALGVTAVTSLTGSRLHRSPVVFRSAIPESSVEIVLARFDVSLGASTSAQVDKKMKVNDGALSNE